MSDIFINMFFGEKKIAVIFFTGRHITSNSPSPKLKKDFSNFFSEKIMLILYVPKQTKTRQKHVFECYVHIPLSIIVNMGKSIHKCTYHVKITYVLNFIKGILVFKNNKRLDALHYFSQKMVP